MEQPINPPINLYPDLDENNTIKPKYSLRRRDVKGSRVYFADEQKTPIYNYSVTTIIDKVISKGVGFDRFMGNSLNYEHAKKFGRERALVGTIVHSLCHYLAWGEVVDTKEGWYNQETNKTIHITDEMKHRLNAFIDFWHEEEPTLLATELPLYDPKLGFAGSLDYVYMVGEKLVIMDVKTGKEHLKEQALQLTAYKILFDLIYGDSVGTIDEMYLLFLNIGRQGGEDIGRYKYKKVKFQPDYWFQTLELFEYLMSDMRGKMPVIKDELELPTEYKIKKRSNKDE